MSENNLGYKAHCMLGLSYCKVLVRYQASLLRVHTWLFLCVPGQVSGRVPSTPIFAFIAGPLMADGSTTAGMWGSLGGWPTFAPLYGLLERAAASCAAEYNDGNVIPADCRCKALQVTTNQAYRCCAHGLYNAWLSFWLWLTPKCMHKITCSQWSVHVLYMDTLAWCRPLAWFFVI